MNFEFNIVINSFIQATSIDEEFNIVPRLEWNATPVFSINAVMNAVPYVIIHHSFTPGECHTQKECANAMKSMQNCHRVCYS